MESKALPTTLTSSITEVVENQTCKCSDKESEKMVAVIDIILIISGTRRVT